MALLICTECGGKVSDKATACPHCGAPVTEVGTTSTKEKPHNDSPFIERENTNAFPNLPVVMNVGDQITNWGLDAALQNCYYSADANHTHYIEEGKVNVMAHTNGICISRGLSFFYIAYEQIIDMKFMSHQQISKEGKSVIGRAVVGGILLGPIVAVVGGLSGVGNKNKLIGNYYLVINFYDVYTHSVQTLLISTKTENPRFIERCEKEKNAKNTPSGNNYVCNLLDDSGTLSDEKTLEALKLIGKLKVAEQIAYIDKCGIGSAVAKIKAIGQRNNIDISTFKSSGCMVTLILILSTALLAACGFAW